MNHLTKEEQLLVGRGRVHEDFMNWLADYLGTTWPKGRTIKTVEAALTAWRERTSTVTAITDQDRKIAEAVKDFLASTKGLL